jgi:cysteine-rich repeat protein
MSLRDVRCAFALAAALAAIAPSPAFALGTCGNGTLDSGEACDDGNDQAGDGCGALCTLEPGWACPIAGQACDALICEAVDSYEAVFLRGNYIEVGLHPSGAFGTGMPSPDGWHGRSAASGVNQELGLVSDPEASGWSAQHGDFFLPGSPEEGWSLEVAGAIASNNRNAPFELDGGFEGAECVDAGACGARGGARVTWELDEPFRGVSLRKRYTLVDGGTFVLVEVELTNTTGAALEDVYYLRTIDPDNDQTVHGQFQTVNEIISQPDDTLTLAHVRASQNVSGVASALSILADDARARVSRGGFANRVPHDVWQGTPTLLHEGSAFSDQAVSIAFQLDLPAHASRSVRYAFALSAQPTDALACVLDQDQDGVIDIEDAHPADPERCSDRDDDDCDDCVSGGFAPADDGDDADRDGSCDLGDEDDDGDGVADEDDANPSNARVCQDDDRDECDDCSITGADGSGGDPDDDGLDADADGVCDASDDEAEEAPDAGIPDDVIPLSDTGVPGQPPEIVAPPPGEEDDDEPSVAESRVAFSGGGAACSVTRAAHGRGLAALIGLVALAAALVRRRQSASAEP